MAANDKIELLPRLPDQIKDAVDNNKLAIFIGAGVSRLVGCDGWDTLARNLVKRCYIEQLITFKESETLNLISDHKKTITICNNIFLKSNLQNIFYEVMKKSLKEGSAEVNMPNIYDDIIKLEGLFVSTNADTHFDKSFLTQKVFYKEIDFNVDKLEEKSLYHIHGSILEPNSLVFTLNAYMKRYTNPSFRIFLEKIFSEYTVLFLGYGLAEFEILDFMLQDYFRKRVLTPKHFMLSPFYSGEENILRFEVDYYKELGINVLGYVKDIKGFSQLEDVVKSWNIEIRRTTTYLHSSAKQIDEAVV